MVKLESDGFCAGCLELLALHFCAQLTVVRPLVKIKKHIEKTVN